MWNGNQRGKSMISTGITGTARQGSWSNSARAIRVNTLQVAAPPRANIASRGAQHMRRIYGVACKLQRVIRLHARADIKRPLVKQGPPAVIALNFAQINGQFTLYPIVDFIKEMFQHDVFGWNRRISFEFENPMAIIFLQSTKRIRRIIDDGIH